MHFQIDHFVFESMINKLSIQRNCLQIIKTITITATYDLLLLQVFNNEVLLETTFPIDTIEEGMATVSIDSLLEALYDTYSDDSDTIELKIVNNKLCISNDTKVKKIRLLKLKEYEQSYDDSKPIQFKIDNCCWEMLEKIPYSSEISTLFEFSENLLTIVYYSVKFLGVLKSEYKTNNNAYFQIPSLVIEKIQNLAGDHFGFEISVYEHEVIIIIEGIDIVFKKINARLDYQYMLSKEYQHTPTTISKKDLSLYITEEHASYIGYAIHDSQVILDMPQNKTDPFQISSMDGNIIFMTMSKRS